MRFLLQICVLNRVLAQFAQLVEVSQNMVKSAITLQRFSDAFESLLSLLSIVVVVAVLTLQMRGEHIAWSVFDHVTFLLFFNENSSVLTIGLSCLHFCACLLITFLFKRGFSIYLCD